jgi:hypothetical protein
MVKKYSLLPFARGRRAAGGPRMRVKNGTTGSDAIFK